MTDANGNLYVTSVNPNDVLFGRGSGPNDHEGNIKFRDLVSQRKVEYMATNHRQTKAKIAKSIVSSVFGNNGRFLKKLEAAETQRLGFANGIDVYTIVDDDTIMEKAKQALRQNREKLSINSVDGTEQEDADAAMMALGGDSDGDGDGLGGGGGGGGGPPNHNHNQNHNHDIGGIEIIGAPAKVQSRSSGPAMYPASSGGNQFGLPEPIPMRSSMGPMSNDDNYGVEQKPLYTEDSEGYATYTTALGDPEEEKLFENRRNLMDASQVGAGGGGSRRLNDPGAVGYIGGPRRGSLLGGRKDPRRESLQMGEVWHGDSLLGLKGESMQMSELMESFKGMSTTGDMNSSSDTIGTIDNMYAGASQMSGISNMSVISMSSTTSLFKTPSTENDSARSSESPGAPPGALGGGGEAFVARERTNSSDMLMSFREDQPHQGVDDGTQLAAAWQQQHGGVGQSQPQEHHHHHHHHHQQSGRSKQILPPAQPRMSLQPQDLWNARNDVNNLMQAPIQSSADLGLGESRGLGDSGVNVNPRMVGQIEDNPDSLNYLGSSSLSILRAVEADQSTSESFRMGNNNSNSSNTQSIFDISKGGAELVGRPDRE